MHLSEFKAWFEGFTEDMDGPPSEKQWKKIRVRVKEITADYTPPAIFIEKYVRPWRPYWGCDQGWHAYGAGLNAGSQDFVIRQSYGLAQNNAQSALGKQTVDLSDWSAAGRAEFRAS